MPPHPAGLDTGIIKDRARCVCDYISGMSDRFAITMYTNIFIPKVWALQ